MSFTLSPPTPPRTPADPQAVDVAFVHTGILDGSLSSSSSEGSPGVGETDAVVGSNKLDALRGRGGWGQKAAHTLRERDVDLEPLLFAAAVASGPHVTRHHYHHTYGAPDGIGAQDVDWSKWVPEHGGELESIDYRSSRQAPRSLRRNYENSSPSSSPELGPLDPQHSKDSLAPLSLSRSYSFQFDDTPSLSPTSSVSDLGISDTKNFAADSPSVLTAHVEDVESNVRVRCMVRTRVPTPHGEVFLHLYHNNCDKKEHLAIVVDPAQLDTPASGVPLAKPIRSNSLDEVWEGEDSEMDRIIRGAYRGRLSEVGFTVSSPAAKFEASAVHDGITIPAPLVRIHSECFTGETIGSMRCDCGEQLDEAIRRIAEPTSVILPSGEVRTIPGRGAVVYMRQEGRGIGLLSKLRAYNLQDLGYDTVQANLMLGHGADERTYDVSAAIMRDLGLGAGEGAEDVRLLTNNPDKVQKLESAGVRIAKQVSMVPRTWRCQGEDYTEAVTLESAVARHPDAQFTIGSVGSVGVIEDEVERGARLRSAGATLIGASTTRGPELEKYLRTKVLRMGHMLSLPPSDTTGIAQVN